MIISVIMMALLMSSVTVNYAFADRFSEWLDVWKKQEEIKAKQYQKDVLHFDYDKIQKKDKGFKAPIISDVKKKHISNDQPIKLKVIKNLNK